MPISSSAVAPQSQQRVIAAIQSASAVQPRICARGGSGPPPVSDPSIDVSLAAESIEGPSAVLSSVMRLSELSL
jgi:hypothetical protein